MDRPSPHSIEFERALLGGLILNPGRLREVAELVKADDFYRPAHGSLFALLLEMEAKGEPIDTITVPERIQRDGRAEQYGGLSYIIGLPAEVPATANVPHYAEVIHEKSRLKRFIDGSREFVDRAYSEAETVDKILEDAAHHVVKLGQASSGAASWQRISLILDEEISRIENLANSDGGATGIPTGFIDLDKMLNGFQRGDLVILAARPSMGKTALVLNMAQNAALIGDVGVGIFSLEMSRHQLVGRMLCTHASVDADKMRKGLLNVNDWDAIQHSERILRRTSIHIDDTPGLSMSEMRSRARRLKAREPNLGLIVVDYLQLMAGDDPSASRQQQVSDLSRGLKALAKDLNVPVVALSQLSRAVEQRAEKIPLLSDLRESGAIEQDADVILFIYRDEYYNKEKSTKKGLATIVIAKQRNGPVGELDLVYQSRFTRFDNLAETNGLDV